MSKFDPKIRLTWGGEVTNQREQAHEQGKGCGDPNCSICMPKDGSGGYGRIDGGGGEESIEAWARRAMEDQIRITSGDGFIRFAVNRASSPTGESEAYSQAKAKVQKYLLKTGHDLAWSDVIGNEAARTALVEAIEAPITHAELYKHYGQRPLKGVLLHGPPGCGKTMFGKAAASVIGRLHKQAALLLKINGPEIQSPYVGVTEQVIRDIFAFARIYAKEKGHPLTIFMDEADAILPSRSGRIAPWEMSNVSTFLAEMDGIEGSGAFVILATNRPEAIDAALLRDGRCDRKIKVERPSREAARAILLKGLKAAPIAGDAEALCSEALMHFYAFERVIGHIRIGRGRDMVDHPFHLHRIVNGAMLVGLVERAKGIAFRRDLSGSTRTGITGADLKEAIDAIAAENREMDHSYALREFIETIGEQHGETLQ